MPKGVKKVSKVDMFLSTLAETVLANFFDGNRSTIYYSGKKGNYTFPELSSTIPVGLFKLRVRYQNLLVVIANVV